MLLSTTSTCTTRRSRISGTDVAAQIEDKPHSAAAA